jgi:hypothetical protein
MFSFQENEENMNQNKNSPSMLQSPSLLGKSIPKNLSSEDTVERSDSSFKIHYLPETSSFSPNHGDHEDDDEERENEQYSVKEMLMDLSSAFPDKEVINLIPPGRKLQQQQPVVETQILEDASVSDEDRLRLQREKEENDSQELIWELMRQEQMELYQMQLSYLQNNVMIGEENGLTEEDMKALQEAMNENNQVIQHIHHPQQQQQQQTRRSFSHEERQDEEEEQDDENSEGQEEDEDEVEEQEEETWDYERLLALGQALGDVKTERWRMRSKSVIESLPKILYSQIQVNGEPSLTTSFADLSSSSSQSTSTSSLVEERKNLEVTEVEIIVIEEEKQSKKKVKREIKTSVCPPAIANLCSPCVSSSFTSSSQVTSLYRDYRCVICMEDFDQNDHLRLLPCSHYYHLSCTTGWVIVSSSLFFSLYFHAWFFVFLFLLPLFSFPRIIIVVLLAKRKSLYPHKRREEKRR